MSMVLAIVSSEISSLTSSMSLFSVGEGWEKEATRTYSVNGEITKVKRV